DFSWCLSRSLTIGRQPPQPVPALVHALISATCESPFSAMALHISPLVTFSQEQICASSGRLSIPPPVGPFPSLAPSRISSGLGGKGMLFCTICHNIL